MIDEHVAAAPCALEVHDTRGWMGLAQRVLSRVFRTDYLSSRRGQQKSHPVLAERSSRRRAQNVLGVCLCPPKARDLIEQDGERAYLQKVALSDRLTSSEEYQLAVRMRAGDTGARNALLEANLGLVVMFARRCRHTGVPMIDLIAEGNLGLLAATRDFDPEMGFRFATYAKWFVLQSMQRARPRLTWVAQSAAPLDEASSANEEAEEPGEPFKRGGWAPVPVPEPDDSLDCQRIPEEEEPPQLTLLTQRRARLLQALACLDSREQLIVGERFALFEERSATLGELAQRLKVSIERVRQIEAAAIRKLRESLHEGGDSARTLL